MGRFIFMKKFLNQSILKTGAGRTWEKPHGFINYILPFTSELLIANQFDIISSLFLFVPVPRIHFELSARGTLPKLLRF